MVDDLLIRLNDDVTQRLTMAAEALHRAPSEVVHNVIVDTNVFLLPLPRASLMVLKKADFMFTIGNDAVQNRTCLYLIVRWKAAYQPSLIEGDVQYWEEWINATLRNTIDRWRVSPGDVKGNTVNRGDVPAVPKKPRPKGIGKYHSGHSDTSQRVDDLVAELLDERFPRHPKSS